ncbi:MAG: hypothetical protein U5K79_22790 [Cyclobacteriaceae bacterium]|nr:hypothetical protein [Cyclobacteriaceae bacterium]
MPAADTIEVNFGENGKILINVESQEDLDALKKYDFNSMLQDVNVPTKEELENDKKVIMEDEQATKYLKDSVEEDPEFSQLENEFDTDGDYYNNQTENKSTDREKKRFSGSKTEFVSGFDWGINNFLENGDWPDENDAQYSVRPWGSWYIGIMPTFQTHIGGKLALDYGAGISWYNFKFQDPRTKLEEGDGGAYFTQWDVELQSSKSKLTVAYINAHFVPMLDFGYRSKTRKYDDGFEQKRMRYRRDGFRIGVGGYVGTRIDSYTKLVWRETGYKSKLRERNDYYIDNLRYGVRGIVGLGEVDFFVNYDLNTIFSPDRGPELNALTFGLSF